MNPGLSTFRVVLLAACLILSGPAGAGVFEDEAGRRVAVPDEPQRIVSLAPSVTEILFALGLGDRVVGVTEFSNHPAEAAAKPRWAALCGSTRSAFST